MSDEIRILQLNIRGILSQDIQLQKCSQLNSLIETKQIDIVLLQEWSANKRSKVTEKENICFPKNFFPNYSAHFHSTECAILYHKGLCITPLPPQEEYLHPNHRKNFHICGILLHSQTTDYAIYSVYRPQSADPNQLFKYNFDSDHVILGGDFNIHHPLWGSDNANKKGSNFVNMLTVSKFQLLNSQTPTRIDPKNDTLSCIDLSLASHNISNIKWKVDHNNHNPQTSDHYHIYINVPLKSQHDETIYHTTWNLSSKRKWSKFQNMINQQFSTFAPPIDPSDHANKINSMIYDTAINTIGYRNYIKTYKPWRNSEIKRLQKETKKLRRKLEKLKIKHPDFYKSIPKYNRMFLEYKDMRNHKNQKIKIAKKQHADKMNQILQKSSFNDKLSWRLIKRNKKSSSNEIPPLLHNDKTITDPTKKAEILHIYVTQNPQT